MLSLTLNYCPPNEQQGDLDSSHSAKYDPYSSHFYLQRNLLQLRACSGVKLHQELGFPSALAPDTVAFTRMKGTEPLTMLLGWIN